MIAGILAALAAANINQTLYKKAVDYHFLGEDVHLLGYPVTVHFLINEIFMVFFFGIAAKEITEAALPGGALNPIRRAINPLIGTVGGIVGPVTVFFLLVWLFYGSSPDFRTAANGWGITTATDIALAWLVARTIFGQRHPAVSFLLLLAVADDAIGLIIIAVFYPDPHIAAAPIWLLLTAAGIGVAALLRVMKVDFWPAYILGAGVLSWIGLAKANVEPALALVVIVPFLPGPVHGHGEDTGEHSEDDVRSANSHAAAPVHGDSALDRFEHRLKLPVDLGLFFFAFANAGVVFAAISQLTAIILVSFIVGKTVGIAGFSLAARQLGFPLPSGMGVRHLFVTGLIGGLGLTVALFVAAKAYDGPPFQDPAKMGALLTAGVSILAIALARALGIRRDQEGPRT